MSIDSCDYRLEIETEPSLGITEISLIIGLAGLETKVWCPNTVSGLLYGIEEGAGLTTVTLELL